MLRSKISVLIPDGESSYAISVLRCLTRVQGVKVHLLSNTAWNMIRFSRYRGEYLVREEKENDELKLEAIEAALKKTGADVIFPIGISTIRLISSHRERILSLAAIPPLAPPEAIDLTIDKSKLTQLLIDQNIPCPETVFYKDGSFNIQDISKLAFPVLVKPVIGEGGIGIMMYNSLSELIDFLNKESPCENYIIQSFVNGYDTGCSVFCENGRILAHTMQRGIIPPYSQFAPPAGVDFFHDEHVYDVIQRLMRILNWSGVANVDMRYDEAENKPKILEVNPRFWGSLIGSLVAGINFPYLVCLRSMGSELPVLEYRMRRYIHHKAAIKIAIRNLMPGGEKKISIRGTGIEYVLNDPMPNIVKFFQDLVSGKLEV